MNQTELKTPRRYRLLKTAAVLTVAMLFGLLICAINGPASLGVLAMLGACGLGYVVSKDHWEFSDDFFGDRTYSATKASNVGHAYTITDTSAAGTPTYADVDGSSSGEIAVDMAADSEIENVSIHQGDQLQFDIDKITEFGVRVKMNQAALDTTSQFAIGLTGDRNDAIDSIAQAALFRLVGADSTTAVVCETDDTVTNNDDKATGETLINAYKWLVISFATGTDDVRFFIDGQPVATDVTFDMSGYTGALQLFAQISKTADTNTDGFTIDAWYVRGRR
jgi:hypothetical protein